MRKRQKISKSPELVKWVYIPNPISEQKNEEIINEDLERQTQIDADNALMKKALSDIELEKRIKTIDKENERELRRIENRSVWHDLDDIDIIRMIMNGEGDAFGY